MKVQIISNDNGSGTITTFDVYKCYNPQQNLFEHKPCCKIEEDEFFELCKNPDLAIKQAQEGKYIFDVPLNQLLEKAIKVYPRY